MSIWHLIWREIWFRRIGFALSTFSVAVAVGCLVGQLIIFQQKQQRVEMLGKLEKDAARKQSLKLGFNLRILPKGFDPVQFYDKDYVEKYMPEKYAEELANSDVITVNHLLPTLQERVLWPEQKLWIDLVGTRGEFSIEARKKHGKKIGKELKEPVSENHIILGYGIHHDHMRMKQNQTVKVGDKVTLMGRQFTVQKLYPKRSGRDNLTAWIHLDEAQQLLNREGEINGILALGCGCDADRMANIRKEVTKLLPETQVEEYVTKAVVRAEMRNAATKRAQEDLESERGFQATLIPVILIAFCVWIGVLAWDNVNRRRTEIGILRALGLKSGHLLMVFLGRAMLVGFIGAVIGLAAGVLIGTRWILEGQTLVDVMFFSPLLLPIVLIAAPALSAVACWLPSLAAIRQDPASVLQPD